MHMNRLSACREFCGVHSDQENGDMFVGMLLSFSEVQNLNYLSSRFVNVYMPVHMSMRKSCAVALWLFK